MLDDRLRQLAREGGGQPVGDRVDASRRFRLSRCEAPADDIGAIRLDPHDPDVRALALDGERDSGNQSATTDRHDDRLDIRRVLENFQSNHALTGDDARIREGQMNVRPCSR